MKSSQNAGARMESDELQSSRADSLARGGPGSPGLSTSCPISLAILGVTLLRVIRCLSLSSVEGLTL